MDDNELKQELQRIAEELRTLRHETDAAYGPERCKHEHTTLCQWIGKQTWFVAHQCDDCGSMASDVPVSADEVANGHELPAADLALYLDAVQRWAQRVVGSNDERVTDFFSKATGR